MSQTILLVEDNPGDELLTLRALKKNGVSNPVDVARDGAEALDYLFARGAWSERDPKAVPMLVLLDVKLPKLDGHDVLEAIRANPITKLVPVVILTSSAEQEDVFRSYSLGANAYVQKPVRFSEFVDAIQALNMFWLITNQPPPPPP